jgi:hypothetical protein
VSEHPRQRNVSAKEFEERAWRCCLGVFGLRENQKFLNKNRKDPFIVLH